MNRFPLKERSYISGTFGTFNHNRVFLGNGVLILLANVLQILVIYFSCLIIYQLRGRLHANSVESEVLQVNLHMSVHDFLRMIWQCGQSNNIILTIKSCRFFRHLHFSHHLIQHINIRFKLYSYSSYIILLIY